MGIGYEIFEAIAAGAAKAADPHDFTNLANLCEKEWATRT